MPDLPIPPDLPDPPTSAWLRHVSCGYGGTGVSPPDAVSVRPCFDVVARAEISALRVVDLAVLDASGATVARAVPPVELRVSLPGRDRDHNPITAPFAGTLEAGGTVRLCATAALTPLPDVESAELRYRATLSTSASETLVLVGPLDDPWPTAGPALLR